MTDRFNSLMNEKRYLLAEEGPAAEIQSIDPQATIGVSTTLESRFTRGHALNLEYRVRRQKGVVDALGTAETAAVPFPDDQPIVYPDSQFWQELTLRRKKYAAVDLKKQSPAEVKIRKALESPTKLDFTETPLNDVVEYLKDLHGIEIQIDTKALEDAGSAQDTPITKNLNGISLRSALRLMLQPMDLGYMIDNEVLLITTKDKVDNNLVTKVYPVADLVLPIQQQYQRHGRHGRRRERRRRNWRRRFRWQVSVVGVAVWVAAVGGSAVGAAASSACRNHTVRGIPARAPGSFPE